MLPGPVVLAALLQGTAVELGEVRAGVQGLQHSKQFPCYRDESLDLPLVGTPTWYSLQEVRSSQRFARRSFLCFELELFVMDTQFFLHLLSDRAASAPVGPAWLSFVCGQAFGFGATRLRSGQGLGEICVGADPLHPNRQRVSTAYRTLMHFIIRKALAQYPLRPFDTICDPLR